MQKNLDKLGVFNGNDVLFHHGAFVLDKDFKIVPCSVLLVDKKKYQLQAVHPGRLNSIYPRLARAKRCSTNRLRVRCRRLRRLPLK